jgi:hypothetical protein
VVKFCSHSSLNFAKLISKNLYQDTDTGTDASSNIDTNTNTDNGTLTLTLTWTRTDTDMAQTFGMDNFN